MRQRPREGVGACTWTHTTETGPARRGPCRKRLRKIPMSGIMDLCTIRKNGLRPKTRPVSGRTRLQCQWQGAWGTSKDQGHRTSTVAPKGSTDKTIRLCPTEEDSEKSEKWPHQRKGSCTTREKSPKAPRALDTSRNRVVGSEAITTRC